MYWHIDSPHLALGAFDPSENRTSCQQRLHQTLVTRDSFREPMTLCWLGAACTRERVAVLILSSMHKGKSSSAHTGQRAQGKSSSAHTGQHAHGKSSSAHTGQRAQGKSSSAHTGQRAQGKSSSARTGQHAQGKSSSAQQRVLSKECSAKSAQQRVVVLALARASANGGFTSTMGRFFIWHLCTYHTSWSPENAGYAGTTNANALD